MSGTLGSFSNAATTEKACGLSLFIAQRLYRIEAARMQGGNHTASSAVKARAGIAAKTNGSRTFTPNRSFSRKRKAECGTNPENDSSHHQQHALHNNHVAHSARLCPQGQANSTPACADEPSTPSAHNPMAASSNAEQPKIVISSILKRWREIESDTTSFIERTSDIGRTADLAQLLLNGAAQGGGGTRVRTTHAIGDNLKFRALAASGT